MKASVILFIAVFSLLNVCVNSNTIFLTQVTSEGARSNTGANPLGTKWEFGPGEITSLGLRQHYLIGYDIRYNYGSELNLDEVYSPWQVSIRSTNHNYTLMGAQAGLEAIFPPNKRDDLRDDQLPNAVPPGDLTAIQKDITDLKNNIMPQNFQTLPIHAVDFGNDDVLLSEWCPKIAQTGSKALNDTKFNDEMENKYKDSLNAFRSYVKQPDWKPMTICDNMDGLYASEFNLEDLGSLKNQFSKLMQFKTECYNQYYSDETSRKLFVNGFSLDLERYLDKAIDSYEQGDKLDNYNKYKLALYYGTLESAYVISRTLGYTHTTGPEFASQLLIALHENGGKYTVKAVYNKNQIELAGSCKGKEECDLDDFKSLLKSIRASKDAIDSCKSVSGGVKLYQQEATKGHTKMLVAVIGLILFTMVALTLFVATQCTRKNSRKYKLSFHQEEKALLVDSFVI